MTESRDMRASHARRPSHVDGGEGGDVGRAPERAVNPRPFALDELEPDAEWLEDEQDIREENGGVHAEPLDGLERHLGRGLRILAQLEEAVARAHRAVL